MTSLIVGLVLIVGGIAFAAAPLLRRRSDGSDPSGAAPGGANAARGHEGEPRAATLVDGTVEPAPDGALGMALDELELDRAMGKLSPADYLALRAGLERRAQDALARSRLPDPQIDAVPAAVAAALPDEAPRALAAIAEQAERLVHALRGPVVACATCGPRPEPGARFCSTCGSSLGGCPRCGHTIAQPDARFCDRCGTTLSG
ncbi:MAG: zinc ribbon domain-containing protein [Gemmatimonadetes bacterium]|nr:zinc ribbon domain-containing protein [Gemmatimonadota bacterium]